MSRLKLLAALLSCSLASLPAAASAQGTGRITGTVTDSALSRGLNSVQVSVVGTRLRAETDDQGRYTITGVPAGTHSLDARRIGYKRGPPRTSR